MNVAAAALVAPVGRSQYRPSPHARLIGVIAVILFHLVLLLLLLWNGNGIYGEGRSGTGPGEPTIFVFQNPGKPVAGPRIGGGIGEEMIEQQSIHADQDSITERAGEGALDNPGQAVLGDELAQLLADDPLSRGGRLAYETILQRHIAARSRPPTDDTGRKYTGIVIVRFRVARDGRIVDARVLRSRTSLLDEAALAALWRSEPLPPVPGYLNTPLEVDVPIDFQVHS